MFSTSISDDKSMEEASTMSFLEWKKHKQVKQEGIKLETNLKDSLETMICGWPTVKRTGTLSLNENDIYPPYETFLPFGTADDFYIPQQQPLLLQDISNPFKYQIPLNNFATRNAWNGYKNHHSNHRKKFNFKNAKPTNAKIQKDLGTNEQVAITMNGNNCYSQEIKNEFVGPQQSQSQLQLKSEPEPEPELQQPKLERKKKKKNNIIWRPKPQEPPPIDFDGPVCITKEERKAQWKAYRDAMKPFKYRPFMNAKREIQRLGKRDRSTLSERELNRLVNAEQFVADHKAYLSLKRGMKGADTWVKAEDKFMENTSEQLGEVYVLQSSTLITNINDNNAGNAFIASETDATDSQCINIQGFIPSSHPSAFANYFLPGSILKYN